MVTMLTKCLNGKSWYDKDKIQRKLAERRTVKVYLVTAFYYFGGCAS